MVIRPDSALGRGQNLATQNIESKADQNINLFFPYVVNCVGGKTVHKAFTEWGNGNRDNVLKAGRTIHHRQGIDGRADMAALPTHVKGKNEPPPTPGIPPRLDPL